jgi:hypothetical protein
MPGKRTLPLPLFFLTGLTLTGCTIFRQHAYYVSPFNANSQTYHPLPMHSDSARTAFYAQASYLTGNANDNGTDQLKGVATSAFVAHHFGRFQTYYGLDLVLGCYNVGKYDTGITKVFFPGRISLPPLAAPELDKYAGGRSFGGVGFSGGINMVKPFRKGEWRFIGLEATLHREFGDYLSFRKKLPDSLTAVNVRSPFFATVGYTTEIICRTPHGEFGFRLGNGMILGGAYLHLRDSLKGDELSYSYINLASHYTYERYTGYAQMETGYKGLSFHLGFVYRFGRPRLPDRLPDRLPVKQDLRRADPMP